MRKRSVIVCGCLAFMLVVCGVIWTTIRSVGPLKISVTLMGYTNDASGARLAIFDITNKGEVRIRRWGVYCVEVQGHAKNHAPLFYGRNAFIAPGQSRVFALPAYTNGAPWRAGIHCSRDGWRRSLSDFAGGLPTAYQFVPDRFHGVPVELVWSDWIEK